MTDGPQRFRRPVVGALSMALVLVAGAVVNKISGFHGGLADGPGAIAVTILGVLALLRLFIFRRPVWVDPSKQEIRWSTPFGLNIGTWGFDEVTSARLSKSWLRRAQSDTILLRIGWIPLSFEVPKGTGNDLIMMLGCSRGRERRRRGRVDTASPTLPADLELKAPSSQQR